MGGNNQRSVVEGGPVRETCQSVQPQREAALLSPRTQNNIV